MTHEHDYLDTTWHWTSWAYADAEMAELAWLQLAKVGKRHRGALEVGFYRHGSSVSGPVVVTALGLAKSGVVIADKVLGAQAYFGFDNEPERDVLEALMARRIRAVAHMHEQHYETGAYEVRRNDPGRLRRDGTYE